MSVLRAWNKLILWSVFVLIGAAALPASAKEKLTILWPTFTQEKIDFGKYLADSFQAANPDIEVELVLEYSKLPVMIAAGTPPDVTWEGANGYPRAAQGWYKDLTPYAARDEREILSRDFFPALWEHTKMGSMRWGMPLSVNLGIFYYNQNLFNERGLTTPNDNWKTTDLLNAAKRLTYDTNTDGSIDKYGLSLELTKPTWFFAYGGPIVSADGKKSLFNTTARSKALEFYYDVYNTHMVAPDATVLRRYGTSNASPLMFLKEDLGIIFGGIAGTMATIRGEAKFTWDVSSWPILDVEGNQLRNTAYTPESLVIPTQAKNPDAAWEFIKFALSVKTMSEITRRGHVFPTRQRVVVSDAWSNPNMLPKNNQAFINSLSFAMPHIAAIHAMGSNMNSGSSTAADAYIANKAPLRETMEKIDKVIQNLLDEYNRKK